MLKVVGASWLQTRISTCILVIVVLLGIGAVIFSEFGHVEKDGTYSATVSWNRKGGYRIDFWGQGNDLSSVKLKVARAYYKTSISEFGWSIIEIETSPEYPDTVQAYAAGLLEGSLTWQLIHHHWLNTVHTACEARADECEKLMRFLRENTAIIREQAELLRTTDPFWHMVHLFYVQLDGLEAGWKFAVRRSRQTVEMDLEHFFWLAMAVDLPDFELTPNVSDAHVNRAKGMIFLKNIPRVGLDPLLAMGHTTAAPYAKMLRLLKKYTFGYHELPFSKTIVPGKSIVMSSYPGALSSHDEFYLIQEQNHELIIAGTPSADAHHYKQQNFSKIMSPMRVMAANRLAIDGRSWSGVLLRQNGDNSAKQWVVLEPRDHVVWLIERLSTGITHIANISEQFATAGAFWLTGEIRPREITATIDENDKEIERSEIVASMQKNITTIENFRRLMRGHSHKNVTTTNVVNTEDESQKPRILAYRGDLEEFGRAIPFGVIDAKIVLAGVNGVMDFEAISGPSAFEAEEAFRWSKSFPNASHHGHPDIFDFDSVTPVWVWN